MYGRGSSWCFAEFGGTRPRTSSAHFGGDSNEGRSNQTIQRESINLDTIIRHLKSHGFEVLDRVVDCAADMMIDSLTYIEDRAAT
jgi:hypothetical protein